jgi:hypothetical protein
MHMTNEERTQVPTQGVFPEGLFPTDWDEKRLPAHRAKFEELGYLWDLNPTIIITALQPPNNSPGSLEL